MEDVSLISVVGVLRYEPRQSKNGQYTYFSLTSDPDCIEEQSAFFNVQVHDGQLRQFTNSYLHKDMKVYVHGEYSEAYTFICGSLLRSQKIKAHIIEIVRVKKHHF